MATTGARMLQRRRRQRAWSRSLVRLPRRKERIPQGGNALGQNGGQGRALHPHAEPENENGIQHDVGDGADDHRGHGVGGKALGGDKVVQPQGDLHEQGAPQIDAQVVRGVADGVAAGAEEEEHGLLEQLEHHGDGRRDDRQQGGAAAQDLIGQVLPALPHADGGPGAAPHTHQSG